VNALRATSVTFLIGSKTVRFLPEIRAVYARRFRRPGLPEAVWPARKTPID